MSDGNTILPLEIPHFLRLRQVQAFIPLSRSQIYAMITEGAFPAPVKLGGRASFWRSEDLVSFLAERSEKGGM